MGHRVGPGRQCIGSTCSLLSLSCPVRVCARASFALPQWCPASLVLKTSSRRPRPRRRRSPHRLRSRPRSGCCNFQTVCRPPRPQTRSTISSICSAASPPISTGSRGVSIFAARKGMREAGVADNDVLIFSKLMDSRSLFLTANADTVYFISNLDLSKGPLVVETPPGALGIFDDLWFRWVMDFGMPGPDRGEGGKYLLLPPGYDGPLPGRLLHRAPDHQRGGAPRPRLPRRRQAGAGRRGRSRRRSRSTLTFRAPTARASRASSQGKGPLGKLSEPRHAQVRRGHRCSP